MWVCVCECMCFHLVLHYLHNKYLAIICYALRKFEARGEKLAAQIQDGKCVQNGRENENGNGIKLSACHKVGVIEWASWRHCLYDQKPAQCKRNLSCFFFISYFESHLRHFSLRHRKLAWGSEVDFMWQHQVRRALPARINLLI